MRTTRKSPRIRVRENLADSILRFIITFNHSELEQLLAKIQNPQQIFEWLYDPKQYQEDLTEKINILEIAFFIGNEPGIWSLIKLAQNTPKPYSQEVKNFILAPCSWLPTPVKTAFKNYFFFPDENRRQYFATILQIYVAKIKIDQRCKELIAIQELVRLNPLKEDIAPQETIPSLIDARLASLTPTAKLELFKAWFPANFNYLTLSATYTSPTMAKTGSCTLINSQYINVLLSDKIKIAIQLFNNYIEILQSIKLKETATDPYFFEKLYENLRHTVCHLEYFTSILPQKFALNSIEPPSEIEKSLKELALKEIADLTGYDLTFSKSLLTCLQQFLPARYQEYLQYSTYSIITSPEERKGEIQTIVKLNAYSQEIAELFEAINKALITLPENKQIQLWILQQEGISLASEYINVVEQINIQGQTLRQQGPLPTNMLQTAFFRLFEYKQQALNLLEQILQLSQAPTAAAIPAPEVTRPATAPAPAVTKAAAALTQAPMPWLTRPAAIPAPEVTKPATTPAPAVTQAAAAALTQAPKPELTRPATTPAPTVTTATSAPAPAVTQAAAAALTQAPASEITKPAAIPVPEVTRPATTPAPAVTQAAALLTETSALASELTSKEYKILKQLKLEKYSAAVAARRALKRQQDKVLITLSDCREAFIKKIQKTFEEQFIQFIQAISKQKLCTLLDDLTRFLAADNSKITYEYLHRLLQSLGFNIKETKNGYCYQYGAYSAGCHRSHGHQARSRGNFVDINLIQTLKHAIEENNLIAQLEHAIAQLTTTSKPAAPRP